LFFCFCFCLFALLCSSSVVHFAVIMPSCKCESSTIALITFGVFFCFLLAVSILASIYFAPEAQAIECVSVKGSGQYLVPLDGGLWSSDAVIASNSSDSSSLNITAYRFAERPAVDSKNLTYCRDEWTSDLIAGSWNAWSFFLVEGTNAKWNATTTTTEPSSFYLFASADDYHDFLADDPVTPIATVNDTQFQGQLSVESYSEYFFVAKASADIKINWQVDFWKATFSLDDALESCDMGYGMCRLKTNSKDYILVDVNDTIQKETKVAVMIPIHKTSYWLFIGALILTSTITIPILFSMLILH